MPDPSIYDLAVSDEALVADETLKTAISYSLMTYARASLDDVVPDPSDLKGWWGDSYAEVPGDSFGCRAWTLIGSPITAGLLETLKQMILEALQWMVEDGYVSGFEVDLEIVQHGVIGAKIGALAPDQTAIRDLGVWEISLNAV